MCIQLYVIVSIDVFLLPVCGLFMTKLIIIGQSINPVILGSDFGAKEQRKRDSKSQPSLMVHAM